MYTAKFSPVSGGADKGRKSAFGGSVERFASDPTDGVAGAHSEVEDLGNAPKAITDALAASGTGAEAMNRAAIAVVEDTLTKAHRAMNYTEISKLNSYVDNIQKQEMHRIKETHESMANNLLLTQRMYLMQNREADKLTSHIRVMLYTMLTMCFAFAIYPYTGSIPGVIALTLLGIVYLWGIMTYFRNARLRRYDDWSKIYWNSDIDAASMATPADDADAEAGECSQGGLLDDVVPATSTKV